jgi:4-amino-4-deoxy-L-arabinose transferase-like glycosyltransferase
MTRSAGTIDRGRTPSAALAGTLLGGLVVLAAVLRFWGIGQQGFWYDEADTALLVRHGLGTMLGLIPHTESTPPLYYVLAWFWVRVVGDHEAGLRSLSALAGVLLVPVIYVTAARLVSRRAGLLAAALTATNPLLIWYSQEARAYALLALMATLSLLAFARAREQPSLSRLLAWVITAGLAMATHYYAVTVVVPEAALLLAAHRRSRGVWLAVAGAGACGLALVPLIEAQTATGNDSWIAHASLHLRLAQILPQFLIGTGMPARGVFKFIAFALALAGLGMLATQPRGEERRGAVLALGVALAGFGLSLAFIAAGSDTLITRNIIELWPPLAIALAAGLAAAAPGPPRALAGLVLAGLCAIGVMAAVAIASTYDLQRPDWRPLAAALGPPPAGGARLILDQHYGYRLPLALYMPGLRLHARRAPARGVVEIDVIGVVSPDDPLCWWGAACNLIPSRVQRHYRIPGFRILWRRRIERFTVLRLVATGPQTVTRGDWDRVLSSTRLIHDVLLIQPGQPGPV